MPKTENRRWFLAPALLSLLTAIAAVNGMPWMAFALLLLPAAAATIAYTSGAVCSAFVCMVVAVCGCFTLPVRIFPLLLPWCALCSVVSCIPLRKKTARPFMWFGLCMAAWIGGTAILRGVLKDPLAYGLAQAICDMIENSPDSTSILLSTYNAGLSRLTGTDALIPAIRFMGGVYIPDDVKRQMLYSLRVTLEEMLPSLLCRAVVFHATLTTLVCTLLPEWRRRKNGEKGELPSPDSWYMPRGIGLAATSLCLGWLVAYLSDGGALFYLGTMCGEVFKAAYMLQGLCLLLWLEKKFGIRSTMRNFWAILLSVLAPVIPVIMGLIDQRKDARHLRPDEEVE